MATEKRIQVFINENTEVGTFQDAIYFSEAEYNALSERDIADLVAARVSKYVETVKNPPPITPPTREELLAFRAELKARVSEVETKYTPTREELLAELALSEQKVVDLTNRTRGR